MSDISNLTAAVNSAVQSLDGAVSQYNLQANTVNSRVAKAESDVAAFIGGARVEYPFWRISKNQMLSGNGAIPDFWVTGSGATYTRIQTVAGSKPWADRTAEERGLLTAAGRQGADYLSASFEIWRVDWTTDTPSYLAYQSLNLPPVSTVAAYTKLLAGNISDHWAHGAEIDQWKITGTHYHAPGNLYYTNCHPIRRSPTGSMLFALPAVVAGRVPIESGTWGLFPYLGDNVNV